MITSNSLAHAAHLDNRTSRATWAAGSAAGAASRRRSQPAARPASDLGGDGGPVHPGRALRHFSLQGRKVAARERPCRVSQKKKLFCFIFSRQCFEGICSVAMA